MQTSIIDTHTHLDHLENADEALARASHCGVQSVLSVGVDLAANRKNIELKHRIQSPRIYIGLGIHPGDIKTDEIEETIRFIEQNIHEASCVGEIGLDFWYKWVRKDDAKKDEQREVYRRLLNVAKMHGLPVVIHSRGAWKYCLEILKEVGVKQGVFHWYSGPLDILDQVLDYGFYVGCTPSISTSPEARQAMAHAPIERTLIETDTPVYYRHIDQEGGFKAEPKDVFKTLEYYAQIKKMDPLQAVSILNKNAIELFGLS